MDAATYDARIQSLSKPLITSLAQHANGVK